MILFPLHLDPPSTLSTEPQLTETLQPRLNPISSLFNRFYCSCSASPSTMSLSSLPTELVRQIIEFSIPSTFHSTTYNERQTILRYLCLVSHRLQQIAQPLLREVVFLTTTRRLGADMELLDTVVFHNSVRHFAVKDRSSLVSNSALISQFIANARNLCTVALARDGYRSFDLSVLRSLSSMYLSLFRTVLSVS